MAVPIPQPIAPVATDHPNAQPNMQPPPPPDGATEFSIAPPPPPEGATEFKQPAQPKQPTTEAEWQQAEDYKKKAWSDIINHVHSGDLHSAAGSFMSLFKNPHAAFNPEEMLKGAGKSVGQDVNFVSQGMSKIMPSVVRPTDVQALDKMETQNTPGQEFGGNLETLAEFMLGEGALEKGLSRVAKLKALMPTMKMLEESPRLMKAARGMYNISKLSATSAGVGLVHPGEGQTRTEGAVAGAEAGAVLGGIGEGVGAGVDAVRGVANKMGEALRPTTTEVGSTSVPVRNKGAIATALQKGVPEKMQEFYSQQTSPAVAKGIGDLAKDAGSTLGETTTKESDPMGMLSHADEKAGRAQAQFQKVDEWSKNKLSEYQTQADNARGDFTTEGRAKFNEAMDAQDSLFDVYKKKFPDEAADIDSAKKDWREQVSMRRVNKALARTTTSANGEGVDYKFKQGKQLANTIHSLISDDRDLLGRAGFTDEHIENLKQFGKIIEEEGNIPKVDRITRILSQIALKSVGGGLGLAGGGPIGVGVGVASEMALEKSGKFLANRVLGKILTTPEALAEVTEAVKGGATPTLLEKMTNSDWFNKVKEGVKNLHHDESGEMTIPGTGSHSGGADGFLRGRHMDWDSQNTKSVVPDQPEDGVIEDDQDEEGGVSNNASGESPVSQEAINRQSSEKSQGVKRVVVDTRSGIERPLIGADAVDYQAKPHESVEFRGGDRDGEVIDQGRSARPYTRKTAAAPNAAFSKGANDTELFQKAKAKLPPGSSLSEIAQEAQRMKDEAGSAPKAAASNQFTETSYADYKKQLEAHPQSATLSDAEDLKNNRHFSNSDGVYYSISPDGDLQGVVNNSDKRGGLAAVVPDAIANGAKSLDAWDIYLPQQYEKYGFVPTKNVPYDVKAYGHPSEALKDGWRQQGWKDGSPYPGVQYMELPSAMAKAASENNHPLASGGLSKAGQQAMEQANATGYKPVESFSDVAEFLPKEDLDRIGKRMQDSIVHQLKQLGDPALIEEAAKAGSIQRGWYKRTGDMLRGMFGDDSKKFTDVFAAMSPMKTVEQNFIDAFDFYGDWVKAGKPFGPEGATQIDKLLKGRDLGLAGAGIRNNVRGIMVDGAEPSGPKVSNFAKNLHGEMSAVTKDRWIANLLGKPGEYFRGSGGSKPGANFLASDIIHRQVAKKLDMLPAEVQESGWSFIRTVMNMAEEKGISPDEAARTVTNADIKRGSSEFTRLVAHDAGIRIALDKLADRTGNDAFRPVNIEKSGLYQQLLQAAEQQKPVAGGIASANPEVLARTAERASAARAGAGSSSSSAGPVEDTSFNPSELDKPENPNVAAQETDAAAIDPIENARRASIRRAKQQEKLAKRGVSGGSDADVPTFYSKAAQVINQKIANMATPEQVRATLKNGGVKDSELQWMGLDSFLKDKTKVSKADLENFVQQNQIQLKDVTHGSIMTAEIQKLNKARAEAYSLNNRVFQDELTPLANRLGVSLNDIIHEQSDTPEQIDALVKTVPAEMQDATRRFLESDADVQEIDRQTNALTDKQGDVISPKYTSWQLGGINENPREVLMQIKPQQEAAIQSIDDVAQREYGRPFYKLTKAEAQHVWTKMTSSSSTDPNVMFEHTHWDEPNIVAHVRMNDRTSLDGKKLLFMEEAQSDWAQRGNATGWKSESETTPAQPAGTTFEMAQNPDGRGYTIHDEHGRTWWAGTHLDAAQERLAEFNRTGIPAQPAKTRTGNVKDMPYKNTWHELAMKKMLRLAAENGYDQLAWTTGAQQAARYSLEKQIDALHYAQDSGGYHVDAVKNGHIVHSFNGTAEKIAEYVGKDIAKKIAEGQGTALKNTPDMKKLSGVDLKIGGEFHRKLYDQKIPQFLEKYAKKWGAKVGTTEIDTDAHGRHEKVHSIEITPEMKKSVMKEGQPIAKAEPTWADGLKDLAT